MSILEKIVNHKLGEIEELKSAAPLDEWKARAKDATGPRKFLEALTGAPPVRLIAEVKKASPSQGVIREDFKPLEIARAYESAGASCISVLTDQHFFQGHLDYLSDIAQAASLPVLRKDFVLDPIQVWQGRACGADAILLIAECLDDRMLELLHHEILSAGMTPLVEFYEESNLERVLKLDPQLVGVNNRNLVTFAVDLEHSLRIRKQLPDGTVFVSESGIRTREDVLLLERSGIDAILVGQSLCEQPDIGLATRKLLQD